MTIMVTRRKEKHRDRRDISRVDFAEPLVTLHTLRSWVPGEALVGAIGDAIGEVQRQQEAERSGGTARVPGESDRSGAERRERSCWSGAYREGGREGAERSGGSGKGGGVMHHHAHGLAADRAAQARLGDCQVQEGGGAMLRERRTGREVAERS